jgi:hypothetical protein
VTLAISFLNPALLGLAALGAIPILIWLLHRQRYRTMRWAAMEFVRRAVRSSRRRLRIENLLLLALRVVAILLAVLAVTRPIVESAFPLADVGERRVNLAIVLDASYSMGFAQGGKSSFERAQKAAHDLAESALKRGDKLAVLVMGESPRFLTSDPVFIDDASKARALRDIMEVELTAQPADAARALAALAQYLPRFERPGAGADGGAAPPPAFPKQVYVFTDLQRSAFATERGLRDVTLRRTAGELARQKADLVVYDLGAEDATNCAVTRLEAADEVAGVDLPLKVAAAVKNFGPGPAHELVVEVYVDETLQASPAISLEAGEEREVDRFVVFREKGLHKVQVVVKTDGLAVDNVRTLAIEAKDAVEVALVDGERKEGFGESETDFLSVALAPGEEGRGARDYLLKPQVYWDTQLSDIDLSKGPVLVLANLVAPAPEQAEKIDAFVKAGGGLLVLLGGQTDAKAWNERLWRDGKGPLPARIDRIVETPDEERYHVLDADTWGHPAVRPFAGKETRPLLPVARFEAYWRLDWPDAAIDDPALSCVAWFAPRRATAGGEVAAEAEGAPGAAGAAEGPGRARERGERDPALVEKRYGRGRCMVFASTADGAWNNFFAQYAYLMLWQKVALHLADAGAARRNLFVGEPFELVVPSSEFTSDILLTTPAGDQLEKSLEKVPDEPDRFRLVHAETGRPGAYEVRFHAPGGAAEPGAAGGAGGGAATSGERVEVFAVNVDPEEGDLTRIDVQELRQLVPELKFRLEREKGGEKTLKATERGPEANELWRYALWALLGVLAIESLLAMTFGRRAA